jgi:SAM-dependent methyltransferase
VRSRFFDVAYEGTPSWEIGRPQPAVVRAAEAGLFAGSVLDIGCGTGEHALFLAGRGHVVLGVDGAPAAVERARRKARERGVTSVRFVVADILRDLPALVDPAVDVALDVGCFHSLGDEEHESYAQQVASAVRPGGRLVLVCWSERNPWGAGPRRITRQVLRAVFRERWRVDPIEEERLEGLRGEIWAWRMTATRR